MSDKSTDDEAPEPVQPTAEQQAAAYAPPTYGPPPAAAVTPAAAPKKRLSERVFGWKSVAAAAVVGLVLGGGIATGVIAVVAVTAAVVDGGTHQGPRELGQMRGGDQLPYGQMPDFAQPQDRPDRPSFPGQSS